MSSPKANPKQPSPVIGMTSITGHKLDALKASYHDLISKVVGSDLESTLLFSHFGDFDTSKVENTLKLIESGILDAGDKRSTMKRVCGMLIELLQNISIHGARDSKGHMHAYLIVAKTNTEYRLYSGNLILADMAEPISDKMENLLSLDSAALRKLYIEILCNEEYSNQGGAGLGLVTIVKRAENQVKFQVGKIDDHFGYFHLEVSVPAQA